MTKKHPIKIVEIHLHKSKRKPQFCHAIALLFPCNHKQYLGVCKTPKNMEGNFLRVESVKIWEPIEYNILDKMFCGECPTEDYWVHRWPRLEEMNTEELYDKDEDDL